MDCGTVEEQIDLNSGNSAYTLQCSRKCPEKDNPKMKCRERSATDTHGVKRSWCVCSDHDAKPGEDPEPEDCHIVLIARRDKDSGTTTRSIECAGSCKGEGQECPKEPVKLKEEENEEKTRRVIIWGCPCQKKKPKGEDKGKGGDKKAPKKPLKKKLLKTRAARR